MTIASDIQDDFSDVLDEDFNKEAVFDGQTIRCFEGMLTTEQISAVAGYQERYKASLYTPFQDWTTFPGEDDRVTFEGKALLVIGTNQSPLNVYFRIDYTEKYG